MAADDVTSREQPYDVSFDGLDSLTADIATARWADDSVPDLTAYDSAWDRVEAVADELITAHGGYYNDPDDLYGRIADRYRHVPVPDRTPADAVVLQYMQQTTDDKKVEDDIDRLLSQRDRKSAAAAGALGGLGGAGCGWVAAELAASGAAAQNPEATAGFLTAGFLFSGILTYLIDADYWNDPDELNDYPDSIGWIYNDVMD